ncbi:hypothetical protein [Crateriforma spongiae]|uniref:hypothetical protein n=1 Tax=Crateriforma spongiae TaxID=2724528 RepID=UPI001444D888|nr:hypothetical protein [Crateriforma spongiae]
MKTKATTRRKFLQTSGVLATGAMAARCGFATNAGQLDRFGGWTGKKFEATGYFRVEKEDRWWFVTPEGNAFLSFGINHLHSDLWQQDFSREAWQQKLGVDDLNDYSKFAPALRKWFLDTCQQWGFNTAGVHTSLNIINKPAPKIAYMKPIRFVDIPHWRTDIPDDNFLDVFSKSFALRCDRLAKDAAAPDDPYLLGYSMTDCPLLTEEDCRERPDVIGGARRGARVGWPRRLRNLGRNSAGKCAYIKTMQEIYRGEIGSFNQTYGTTFDSFDALENATDWRPTTDLSNANETRDNLVFLKTVVAKYYETARNAIRTYDPNHLFCGDKLNANTDSMDVVFPVTSQYTDFVMYQMYGRYEVQRPGLDRWTKVADMPFVNGDSAFTMITPTMPRPYGPVADSLQQRAEWTAEFFLNAFARPNFIGWHYCGLIDATQNIPRKQARQHSGVLNEFGEPYPDLLRTVKRCSESIYHIASG